MTPQAHTHVEYMMRNNQPLDGSVCLLCAEILAELSPTPTPSPLENPSNDDVELEMMLDEYDDDLEVEVDDFYEDEEYNAEGDAS